MTDADRERIGKKLIGMSRRLSRLFTYQQLTFEEYLQDEDRQASIERYMEIVIQAAIDINKMLIKHVENIDLERLTNTEVFTLAGELGFISSELATQLALSAGFRNVLAHVYDDIDPEIAYRALQLSVMQYPQYIQQIQTYLNLLEDDE
ncbi:MAG: DUF86 domain-containing protein [Leptolyngbyaceae cyanobacterium SU_3_3]|nr:DUF86 domain-containing protein [Leptolyngbyaceae cyanobacterium SU_3_3]NJR50848.1 DUF86 domain-containing protein [Leptolyngbyaceae cyanobacterium CSU_1_3]